MLTDGGVQQWRPGRCGASVFSLKHYGQLCEWRSGAGRTQAQGAGFQGSGGHCRLQVSLAGGKDLVDTQWSVVLCVLCLAFADWWPFAVFDQRNVVRGSICTGRSPWCVIWFCRRDVVFSQ